MFATFIPSKVIPHPKSSRQPSQVSLPEDGWKFLVVCLFLEPDWVKKKKTFKNTSTLTHHQTVKNNDCIIKIDSDTGAALINHAYSCVIFYGGMFMKFYCRTWNSNTGSVSEIAFYKLAVYKLKIKRKTKYTNNFTNLFIWQIHPFTFVFNFLSQYFRHFHETVTLRLFFAGLFPITFFFSKFRSLLNQLAHQTTFYVHYLFNVFLKVSTVVHFWQHWIKEIHTLSSYHPSFKTE